MIKREERKKGICVLFCLALGLCLVACANTAEDGTENQTASGAAVSGVAVSSGAAKEVRGEGKSETAAGVVTLPEAKNYKNRYKSFYYNISKKKDELMDEEGIEIGGVDTVKLDDVCALLNDGNKMNPLMDYRLEYVCIASEVQHIGAASYNRDDGRERLGASFYLILKTEVLSSNDIFKLLQFFSPEDIVYKERHYSDDETKNFYKEYFKNIKEEQNFICKDGIVLGSENETKIVRIPDGITKIAPGAFPSRMDLIEEVYLPDSVKEIGQYAFGLHENIRVIHLGNGVEKIGACALSGKVKKLVIPESVKQLAWNAFDFRGECLEELIFEGSTGSYFTDNDTVESLEGCSMNKYIKFTFKKGIRESFTVVREYELNGTRLSVEWAGVVGADGYKVTLEDTPGDSLGDADCAENKKSFKVPKGTDCFWVYIQPYKVINGRRVYGRKSQTCIDESDI